MFQSPFDQPEYKPKPKPKKVKKAVRKKAKKKAKKAKKKVVRKKTPARKKAPVRKKAPRQVAKAAKKVARRAPRKLPAYPKGPPLSCNRSPCGEYDPKFEEGQLDAAREYVFEQGGAGEKLHRGVATKNVSGSPVPQGTYVRLEGQTARTWIPTFKKTKGVHRPAPKRPLVIAYGLGLDSTAILVGLVQEYRKAKKRREKNADRWRPSVISFADVGSEKKISYQFLRHMNAYLLRNNFPPVTVVAWRTAFGPKGWGGAQTLEQQVLINQSGPSITEYFGDKSKCSSLWKQEPQNTWMKEESGLWAGACPKCGAKSSGTDKDAWVREPGGIAYCSQCHQKKSPKWKPKGGLIVKAIGYDAEEGRRMAPDGGGGGATFRINLKGGEDSALGDGYHYWYPLVEWGWDRARCAAEVEKEMGGRPPKSSCTFCFAMKPFEVVTLSKDDAKRAVFMELVRRHGRQAYRLRVKKKAGITEDEPGRGVVGLAGGWSWTDLFLYGALAMPKRFPGRWSYGPEKTAKVIEMTKRAHGGRSTVITQGEFNRLDSLAKEFVARSPDKGRSIQVRTLSLIRVVKILGFMPNDSNNPVYVAALRRLAGVSALPPARSMDMPAWERIYRKVLGKKPRVYMRKHKRTEELIPDYKRSISEWDLEVSRKIYMSVIGGKPPAEFVWESAGKLRSAVAQDLGWREAYRKVMKVLATEMGDVVNERGVLIRAAPTPKRVPYFYRKHRGKVTISTENTKTGVRELRHVSVAKADLDLIEKVILSHLNPISRQDPRADVHFKGKVDFSLDPWLRRNVAAFRDLNGFRGRPSMSWDRPNPPDDISGYTSDTLRIPTDLYGIAWPPL
jgi:hypothetical protein